MKYYSYNEYRPDTPDDHNMVITMSEEEILREYWDYWSDKMAKKYGKNSPKICKQLCIEEWVVVHWAWEVSET